MGDECIGNLLGKSWHSFDVAVWCAVVTLSAVLVAKESSLASATKVENEKRLMKVKTYVKPVNVSVQTVLSPQLSRPSAHSSLTQAPSSLNE